MSTLRTCFRDDREEQEYFGLCEVQVFPLMSKPFLFAGDNTGGHSANQVRKSQNSHFRTKEKLPICGRKKINRVCRRRNFQLLQIANCLLVSVIFIIRSNIHSILQINSYLEEIYNLPSSFFSNLSKYSSANWP